MFNYGVCVVDYWRLTDREPLVVRVAEQDVTLLRDATEAESRCPCIDFTCSILSGMPSFQSDVHKLRSFTHVLSLSCLRDAVHPSSQYKCFAWYKRKAAVVQ